MQNLYQSPISPGISWYEASIEERPEYDPLDGDIACDVVVIGGGFTGLSCAYHLAKAGTNVVLIEAHQLGDGASGRNGGQLGSGQRAGVLELEKQFGFERSKALWDMAEDAKRNLHEVALNGDFEFNFSSGQLTPMHKKRYEKDERNHIEAVSTRYGYDQLGWLDQNEMATRLGSTHYYGGAFDAGTGHIHPLKYLIGLAKTADKAGAKLYEQTRALKIQTNNNIRVETSNGIITADKCLLALNGYHDDIEKQTARSVMPIQSFIGATEPLPDDTEILPGGEAVDDSRFVVRYFRKSKDNRLLFGGRETYSNGNPGNIEAGVRRQMCEIYPALKDTPITHAWGGSVAITMPRMPYVREVEPGLWSAGGYSGHGVMLSNYTGRLLAEKFLGKSPQLDLLSELKISPFPGGPSMRSPLLFAAMTWYSLIDKI